MAALAPQMSDPVLRLPPAYGLVSLEERADAFDHACRIAREAGAGTFVYARPVGALAFAVVLEPEEPLLSARRALYAGMNALADALSAYGPPEKPVAFQWPTTILFDGARLGAGRLGWPEGCAEDVVPEWLVFSGTLLAAPPGGRDPGHSPDVTWLSEEGFEQAEHPVLVESFARHLMLGFDIWSDEGFPAVAEAYLDRLPRPQDEGRRGIDLNGDLLLHRSGGVERVALLPALGHESWLDLQTGFTGP